MNLFPILYAEQHRNYHEDFPFWLKIARQHGSPILELGCGTGRVAKVLAQAGHQVFGLDRDQGMLALHGQNDNPAVFCGDMCHFHLNSKFSLIITPCNTYSTLTAGERSAVLDRAARHLAEGGEFVACLPNPILVGQLPEQAETDVEEIIIHPLSGQPVQISTSWQRTPGSIDISWHYDELFPDGRVTRLTTTQRHYIVDVGELAGEFEQAGLRLVQRYGTYTFSAYQPSSPYLLMIGK